MVFDPVPASRELKLLDSQLDVLLRQLQSTDEKSSVQDVLLTRLSSPIVMLKILKGTLNSYLSQN